MAGFLDPVTQTTIANYAKGAWDNLSQNNPVFREIKKRGNIEYDVGGESLEGPIEAGRYAPIVSAPGMDLTAEFQPRVRHKRWSASWGEIVIANVIDRGLLRRNSGDQALVRLRDTECPAMWRDLIIGTNGLAHQILNMNSGTYTGDGLPMNGLPTFLLAPGATGLQGFNPDTGAVTGVGPADTDREVAADSSSQTYMGLNLYPSGITGVDNVEADAWQPTLVNSSATAWTGTNDDEANAMLKVCQHAVNRMCRFSQSDQSKKPSYAIGDFTFFNYLGQLIANKQTIYVQSGQATVETPNLGYEQFSLKHAGLNWWWDENMPASTWYLIPAQQMKLKLQPLYQDENAKDKPFKSGGEDAGIIEVATNFDPFRRQYLISGTIPGQLVCNPRYFGRISAYS